MNTFIKAGDILNSRYRILKQLGQGGFGRTYLAEDLNRFNEHCVLKEFAPQLEDSFVLKKGQELFEREAGMLYRLQHPQIPKFRELFKYKHNGKGRLLLVQEYFEGQTYDKLFDYCAQKGKGFSEAQVKKFLCQLLPVLEYIHSIGLIHRDISPDNIILRSSDKLPVLIDFGSIKEIATQAQNQLIGQDDHTDNPYLMGTIIGKLGYAPPEQIGKGMISPQSDLYALAATAVVLLTGKKPQQLISTYSYEWTWQKEVKVSPKLKWVLTKMLSFDPGDRFSSATEVRKILENMSVPKSGNKYPLPTREGTSNVDRSVTQQPSTSRIPIFSRLLSPKNLLLALLAGSILLGSSWWLRNKYLTSVSPTNLTPYSSIKVNSQISKRFSQGEKILIPQVTTAAKESAVAAFAQGNYQKAGSLFSESLKNLANDPESLIYFNNAQIGEEKSYSIAVSVPIGFDVNTAQEMLRGVAQAQNQVNHEGGIDGIPLKVQIINDDNNLEVAQQVATVLSQNPEILGVIGHYASDVTLAAAKIYQLAQLVAISPVSTSVELSNMSPYLFRTVPSDFIAGRGLAKYMLEEVQKQNVAVYYNSQSNYSRSLKSEFATAVVLGGGEVVNEFDLSDPNFSAADSFKQASNKGAEAIMLAANTSTLDQALQVIKVNQQRLSLLGGDDVYTPKTLQIAGEFAQDMVLAIPWHMKNNINTEFVQNARKLWQGDVNWRTETSYNATCALIAAIDSSRGTAHPEPTRTAIQKALSHPNFSTPGASSKISFYPSGDRLKGIELVKVQPSSSNSSSYEFVPVVSQR